MDLTVIDLTRNEKAELRRLSAEAYEQELVVALGSLEEQFKLWRAGKLGVFDLDEQIHKYYSGARRELYKCYVMSGNHLSCVVNAIARDLLQEASISPVLWQKLHPMVRTYSLATE